MKILITQRLNKKITFKHFVELSFVVDTDIYGENQCKGAASIFSQKRMGFIVILTIRLSSSYENIMLRIYIFRPAQLTSKSTLICNSLTHSVIKCPYPPC